MSISQNRQAIAEAIRAADSIILGCHVRPDGDALGSVLGLAASLRQLGKTVYALSEHGVPSDLDFLPGADTIIQPSGETIPADLAISLDTATQPRLGEHTNTAMSQAKQLIVIDHHKTNPGYGDLNLIDASVPATGMILHQLLQETQLPLPQDAVDNFFVAISTDTGSFQFGNTTGATLRLVADMVDNGLQLAELNEKTYMRQPMRKLKLLGELLAVLSTDLDDQIASWTLTQDIVQRHNLQPEDSEGLIDHIRAVHSVKLAIFFEELADGGIRISSRSKDPRLDVSELCGQFGGGGHAMAAGARMQGPIEQAREQFLAAAKQAIQNLN